ncbi:MAG: cytochrome c biogenesis protein [Planctomycetes bacterium]|nr:cytochrome c biogenesis protein [Planctomycetota bacterium]
MSGISTICFAACYAIAFALELVGLRVRFAWHRAALVVITLAGLAAHTLYLSQIAADATALPVSTVEWLLLAAWVLAIIYFAALFYLPRSAVGVVLLPIVLGLIVSSLWASPEPLAPERSFYAWSMFHGIVLLLGAVAVCIGFLAGLMYLVQSYGLKHVRSAANRLRLPSLEWLEHVNSRALGISALFIGLGFVSGIVMALAAHRGETSYHLWTDPVVLSLAAMLVWLVAAEIFRLVYPAARRGRKVAYLTLASFVFLVIALASLMLLDNVHGNRTDVTIHSRTNCGLRIADCGFNTALNPKSEIRNPKSNT